jgi:hypothetical protein
MNKSLRIIMAIFIWVGPAWSIQHSIAVGHMMDSGAGSSGMDRPQIARDLEGLDPKEGGFSKGLRGSFVIKHYISGPWVGGSAIIEIASDLSYAEIRIFDKDNNLQRIYSIQPKSENARINATHINDPILMVEENSTGNSPNASQKVQVSRSPEREAAVQAQTVQASHQHAAEIAAAYPEYRSGTVSSRAGDIREGSTEEEIEARERAESAPKKKVVRVRRKKSHKKSSNPLDTPLSGGASQDEYYYEEVVVDEKPTSPSAVAQAAEKEDQKKMAQVQTDVASAQVASSKYSVVSAQGTVSKPSAATAPPVVYVPQVASASSSATRPVSTPSPASATSAYDESNLPDVNQAVHENEKEEEPRGKKKLESDQWKPKSTQVASLPESAIESPAENTPPVRQKPVVTEDLSDAQRAATKIDSDNWSPKPSGPGPTDAELGLNSTTQGSSRRSNGKRSRGRGEEGLVPMSDDVKNSPMQAGGEAWSPSATSSKLSSKEESTLAMINTLKTPPQTPVAKVNRDVNNPDEGVRPFYSLEKYSGAQYGRHREFERRVVYKQNKASPVKGYEFYIDEVDRKQEKHYLYYYKIDPKTKKAQLIATERHEHVTFLGNYDIGSEEKGKIEKE